ncbi:MAG: hypothetical protein EXQ85_03695 [Alphaproteobacteria bacterium]|nr:hypothetical protein [Alphaproteobacteria bacterium]
MLSEIRLATQGVGDLARTVRFYQEALLFEVKGRGRVAAAHSGGVLGRAWRMPADLQGEFAVMGPLGIASGLIRLVQFDRPGRQIWEDYRRPGDFGLFATNFRVRDMQVGWERLQRAGARPRSQPHFWKVSEAVSVHDSMCWDPDGTLIDVFEVVLHGPSIHSPLGDETSELQTVVVHTEHADRCRDFYVGLGYNVNMDKTLAGLEDFLKLPKGVKLRNLNLAMKHRSPNGRIEISQYVGQSGVRLRDRAAPPAHGILAMSFESDDLAADDRRVRSLGAEPVGGAYTMESPPFGPVTGRCYAGPDGETIEIFQRA